MTTATAADYLDCSERHVRRLCEDVLAWRWDRVPGTNRYVRNIAFKDVQAYRKVRLKRLLA